MKYQCYALHSSFDFSNPGQAIKKLGCEKCKNFLLFYCEGPEELPEILPAVESFREQLSFFD